MNKGYIETILREENMVSFISRSRTQFNTKMTEFYFFKTFFTALNSVGIRTNTIRHRECINGGIKTDYYIILNDINDIELSINYDKDKLNEELNRYNNSFENTSMLESTNMLIDIFLSLFD